jgi:hypothetical protein
MLPPDCLVCKVERKPTAIEWGANRYRVCSRSAAPHSGRRDLLDSRRKYLASASSNWSEFGVDLDGDLRQGSTKKEYRKAPDMHAAMVTNSKEERPCSRAC